MLLKPFYYKACEGKEGKEQSANARYSCSLDGEVSCNLGWTGIVIDTD